MNLLLIGVGLFVVVGLVLSILVAIVIRWRTGKRVRVTRLLALQLILLPLHCFVSFPLGLAIFGRSIVGTRLDERAYQGPVIAADGTWQFQSRTTLRAGPVPPPSGCRVLALTAADGTPIRAFHVPAAAPTRPGVAVMVHGLFRGALELEPPASMLRDLGIDVVIVEMRNHGGSGRATPTFGRDESTDVTAAIEFTRTDPALRDKRLILFGVSLGTVAAANAAARAERVDGIVLDAPVVDSLATAHRMLASRPEGQPRRIGLPQPFRTLTLLAVEWVCGISFHEIGAGDALASLPPRTAALVIGGVLDDRVSTADAQRAFDLLRAAPADKELWLPDGAGHGDAWLVDPAGYRERLGRLVERALR